MAVVSNSVSLNYTYFSQAFKAYTGLSFVQYVKRLRITEAKKLLECQGAGSMKLRLTWALTMQSTLTKCFVSWRG